MGFGGMKAALAGAAFEVMRRQAEEADPEDEDTAQNEIYSSWALFIMIALLIIALFTSYILQQRQIQAVHETVISIFAGMTVGLILRLNVGHKIQQLVTFSYTIFFNLLLPPIILASGYELHQANFFRNIGTILTFAFAGTFISAVVLGLILWLYTHIIPFEPITMSWVEAISVGATLSATDPVTILAIFNTYKVDPKLYTIIFGESILNDAIAIVLFETAQSVSTRAGTSGNHLGPLSLLEGVGMFLALFFGSLVIGVIVGILTALGLKYTYVRRYPKIESCLIILIAYASYFFSNGLHMSGIVSLLFCGITLKHYAYYNMSRRTQLTTKYLFQVLAQLSENFIFIYLGLSLFTDTKLQFQPLLIIVTVFGICVARWAAVFPLSKLINWFIRVRAKRRGRDVADELPYSYQAMLFWAGLRGAVGVALAAGLVGENAYPLKATVLVVVVLTVIIFGGTTARMLEILGIRTGVVEEIDSDDEFDIEAVTGNGHYYKNSGTAIGHNPRRSNGGSVSMDVLSNGGGRSNGGGGRASRGYSSGNASPQPRPDSFSRKSSTARRNESEHDLLGSRGNTSDDEVDDDDMDLPPPARRPSGRTNQNLHPNDDVDLGGSAAESTPYPTSGSVEHSDAFPHISASGAIRSLIHGTAEDHAAFFKQLDEDFIKPTLLLDGGNSGRGRGGHGSPGPSGGN